jgi:hypothetical protein
MAISPVSRLPGAGPGHNERLRKEDAMAACDDLKALAKRVRIAEDRVSATRTQARPDIEAQTARARTAAQQQADRLLARTAYSSARWPEVQHAWSVHVTAVRADVDRRRADRDGANVQHRADVAEHHAALAVAFAEAALAEAEFAALEATLARLEAEVAAVLRAGGSDLDSLVTVPLHERGGVDLL